jgi:hypothetical protein
LVFIVFHTSLFAQKSKDFTYVDSLTYKYYNAGNWDSLIKLGNEAIRNNIDYKYLRQRMGYACFVNGDNSAARIHFEKAFSFDSFDQFTLEYLYYTYLNTGKSDYTGKLVKNFSPELKKRLQVKPFIITEGIDLEYNYKYAGTVNRSNPQYFRLGISTKLGHSLSLYQSVSNYTQVITSVLNGNTITTSYKQPEYFALFKWNALNRLLINGGYHYFNTTSGTFVTPGHLLLFAVSKVLYTSNLFIYQAGGNTTYVFHGKQSFTLKSSLAGVFHQTGNQLVFNQMAGLKLSKRLWIEANGTFGRMSDYNDYDGLYLYNTYDPIDFRLGGTLVWYLGNKISIWANYTFERKEYFENNSFHYNQFSYLGGIKWKL